MVDRVTELGRGVHPQEVSKPDVTGKGIVLSYVSSVAVAEAARVQWKNKRQHAEAYLGEIGVRAPIVIAEMLQLATGNLSFQEKGHRHPVTRKSAIKSRSSDHVSRYAMAERFSVLDRGADVVYEVSGEETFRIGVKKDLVTIKKPSDPAFVMRVVEDSREVSTANGNESKVIFRSLHMVNGNGAWDLIQYGEGKRWHVITKKYREDVDLPDPLDTFRWFLDAPKTKTA